LETIAKFDSTAEAVVTRATETEWGTKFCQMLW